jgi:hypothetical protein
LDHVCGCSWCAPWRDESGTPARDQAGHIRTERCACSFRRSDDLPLTPSGLQPGLTSAKPQRDVFIPTSLFLPSRAETESHTGPEMNSADQLWHHRLETVLAPPADRLIRAIRRATTRAEVRRERHTAQPFSGGIVLVAPMVWLACLPVKAATRKQCRMGR